jgi:hypothetical protein
MKITTETGSVYEIDDHGICRKYDKSGECIDSFKVWYMVPVPNEVVSVKEIYDLPKGDPEIGKRLYIGGKDSWWVSTRVVSIE